jgi:hypothetical protein
MFDIVVNFNRAKVAVKAQPAVDFARQPLAKLLGPKPSAKLTGLHQAGLNMLVVGIDFDAEVAVLKCA